MATVHGVTKSRTWPEQLTHFKNLTYISWLWIAFTSRQGRARYAPLIFLQHWDSVSVLRIPQAPVSLSQQLLCGGEKMKILGRCGGAGEWEDGWTARESQKKNRGSANGLWQSGRVGGSWPRWCLFPQDKEGSDAEHQAVFDSAKGAVIAAGLGCPEKRGLNLESELKSGNKEPPKGRAVAGSPGLLGVCRHSDTDWSQRQGQRGQVFFNLTSQSEIYLETLDHGTKELFLRVLF